MKSMTGYGAGEAEGKGAKVSIQLRTLNHRHLDIQLRMPREYLPLEEEMRKLIRQRVSRGRVELFLSRSPLKGAMRTLEIDESLLGQYVDSLQKAQKKYHLKGDVDLALFSSLPEIFQLKETEASETRERGLVLRSLDLALQELERSRQREGRQLQLDMESQVRSLKKICVSLAREAKKISARFKEVPSSKEAAVPEAPADALNLTFKGDIHEEVVRLQSHVAELARALREREPVGKKLDFLLQEVQRELNTVSSKAPQLPAVQLVLEGKERVEKIREQAQNVE